MSVTTVYQYFAASGALIYVGITDRGVRRSHEHAESKEWWPLATGCTLEHFATRDEALARERELIQRFRPPYNYQHNPERAVPIEQRVARRLPTAVPKLQHGRPSVAAPVRICSRCHSRPAPAKRRRLCLVCRQTTDPSGALECEGCGLTVASTSERGFCRSCEGRRGRLQMTTIPSSSLKEPIA